MLLAKVSGTIFAHRTEPIGSVENVASGVLGRGFPCRRLEHVAVGAVQKSVSGTIAHDANVTISDTKGNRGNLLVGEFLLNPIIRDNFLYAVHPSQKLRGVVVDDYVVCVHVFFFGWRFIPLTVIKTISEPRQSATTILNYFSPMD